MCLIQRVERWNRINWGYVPIGDLFGRILITVDFPEKSYRLMRVGNCMDLPIREKQLF